MKRSLRKELSFEKQEELRKKDRIYYRLNQSKRNEDRRKAYKIHKPRFLFRNKKSVLRVKYGLSWEEYQDMFERQNGVCAICEKTEEGRMLSVDHKHDETGKVRGLLCGSCNRALGLFKDDPELLQRAKEYVS